LEFKNIDIIKVIAEIVDDMRVVGTITSAVFDGIYTTIISENTLKNRDVVMIGSIDYVIKSVLSTKFQVKGDATGNTTYKSLAPYFSYGHILEIANELTKKDNSTAIKSFEKYPIILLPLDLDSEFNPLFNSFDYTNVRLIIANKTQPTYTSKDRIKENFDPILYPLYEQLITGLSRNRSIIPQQIAPFTPHKKTDRLFWGSQLNNNANVVNDFLDAIEVSNLSLRIINTKCK